MMSKYIRGKFAATRYSITPAGRMALTGYLEGILALVHQVEEAVDHYHVDSQAIRENTM